MDDRREDTRIGVSWAVGGVFWAGQRRVGVGNTVTKNLENHPQHSYVSCPVGGGSAVGAAAYLEVLNIN